MSRAVGSLALLVIVLSVFTACGGNNTHTPSQPAVTVTIAPAAATVLVGTSAPFSATVTGTSITGVSYSVLETLGGQVALNGLYTARQQNDRALSNVIRNAVRYAGHAGPIDVTAQDTSALVPIRVSDRGPGLAENELQSIFEPFYRPEPARRRDTGGVGLGLAIVKSCVESCQGSVVCRNRKGGGLEVELVLRCATPEPVETARAQAHPVS